MSVKSPDRHCLECEKILRGRIDKKFCDDYCRNAYNNRNTSEASNYVRNINNALKRNRRILQGFIKEGEELGKCPRQKLVEAGYDFSYGTHQYTNAKGQTYFFCYEYGYLPLEGDWALIVRRKEKQTIAKS